MDGGIYESQSLASGDMQAFQTDLAKITKDAQQPLYEVRRIIANTYLSDRRFDIVTAGEIIHGKIYVVLIWKQTGSYIGICYDSPESASDW